MARIAHVPFKTNIGGIEVDLDNPDYTKQTSTFKTPDGYVYQFYIPMLTKLAKEYHCPIVQCAVTPEQAAYVVANNGIEQGYLDKPHPPSWLEQPGLLCGFPNDEHVIVDGNRRYVWHANHGVPFMAFHMVPQWVWFLSILDFPNIRLNHSGV